MHGCSQLTLPAVIVGAPAVILHDQKNGAGLQDIVPREPANACVELTPDLLGTNVPTLRSLRWIPNELVSHIHPAEP